MKSQAANKSDILNFSSSSLQKAPLQKIENEFLYKKKIKLFIKRLDIIHPEISGNKWYKLKYNLIKALEEGHDTLLTFGGAYSNHIYAAASAGKIFNFNTIGIIRGELTLPLNKTLSFAESCGMRIKYLNRNLYRDKYNCELLNEFKKEFGNFYLIPEGGTNTCAVKGTGEIIEGLKTDFDFLTVPCGTGGTLAGLAAGLNGKSFALGFSVLKGAEFLRENVRKLIYEYSGKVFNNWDINLDYHYGGYAKAPSELIKFVLNFENEFNIPIESIYTGKMFSGIFDLISKGYFPSGCTIIALHTGGLQGKILYE